MYSSNPVTIPAIYWLVGSWLDKKIDKATIIEMVKALNAMGQNVMVVAAYKNNRPIVPVEIFYLGILRSTVLARISFNVMSFLFMVKRFRYERDIIAIILDQNTIYSGIGLMIVNSVFFRKKLRLHFDVRTVPVENRGIKGFLEYVFFWCTPLVLAKYCLNSYSFITKAMQGVAGFNNMDCCIWSSGVNLEKFNPEKYPSIKTDNFIIFYHGVITPNRGLRECLKALSSIKETIHNVLFRIVGDGSDINFLRDYVSNNNLSKYTEFVGFVDYEKIPSLISEADVCICTLPDIPWWRVSSPLKVIEYTAMGKPCILTEIQPHQDYILEGTKGVYWAGKGTPEEIANAILAAYNERKYFHDYSHSLREIALNYTWEKQASILHKYLLRNNEQRT